MALALLAISLLFSCSPRAEMTKEPMETPLAAPDFSAGPPTLVYKTKKGYRQQVAVTLSEDKSTIVSYPDPADVAEEGPSPYPTPLRQGYLLDNRGLNPQVAFLRLTYGEYSKLRQPPSLAELENLLLDKDPLLELWHCGTRLQYRNVVQDLNARIGNMGLAGCRRVK